MFNLKINNFRKFKNAEFNFSRINILIGENSSGKSSLIKFLLMLEDSMSSQETNLKISKDLGNYKNVVYWRDEKENITFQFDFGNDYFDYFKRFVPDLFNDDNLSSYLSGFKADDKLSVKYTITSKLSDHKELVTEFTSSNYGTLILKVNEDKKDVSINSPTCDLIYTLESGESINITNVNYDKQGFMTLIIGTSLNERIKAIYQNESYDTKGLFIQLVYFLALQNYLVRTLFKLRYLNPMKSNPERVYLEQDSKGIYAPEKLQDVVNILSDINVDIDYRDFLLRELKKALQNFKIAKDIRIRSSDFGAKELQVQVDEGLWCNIMDVGYGVALHIPIFFQAIISEFYSDGEILIIEQPEIHIHPYLQSKLIETLLSIGPKNSYIIETHSQDIIRKLQVIVRKEQLEVNQKDVSIHYFKNGKGKSDITKHFINNEGKLDPIFPSGFFDSSYSLVKELL